jgi:hypothetical protein
VRQGQKMKERRGSYKPENIGIVISGRNRDICLARYICERQYNLSSAPSNVQFLSSERFLKEKERK